MQDLLIALWRWLSEGKRVWYALLVVLFACVVASVLAACTDNDAGERAFRYVGLMLQAAGIWAVVLGAFKFVRPWLNRNPLIGRDVTVALTGQSIAVATGEVGVVKSKAIDPNASVPDRLTTLETSIGYIGERFNELEAKLDRETHKRTLAIKAEEDARIAADNAMKANITVVETKGLQLAAIGAIWAFFGAVLSTAAPELACLFR